MTNERSQKQGRSMSIQDVGSVYFHCQNKALRIDKEMTLAPKNFFAPIIAAFIPTHGTGLDRLTEGGRRYFRSGLRPIFTRSCLRKAVCIRSQVPSRFQSRK